MKVLDKVKESLMAKLLIIIIILWIILAIVFGYTDLMISQAIVDTGSLVGLFGEYFGELPGYGLIGISISIIIRGYIEDIKKQKVGSYIVIIFGIILSSIGVLLGNYENLGLIGLSLAIAPALFYIVTINKDWRHYYIIALIIGALALFNTLLITYTIKILCGRVRFEDLGINFSEYTLWFLPPGPSFTNRSFPSGHTSLAWLTLPFLIIVKDLEWKNPKKIVVVSSVLTWGIFVAISRVLLGKHYASDVLFATGLAVIVSVILYNSLYLNKEKIMSTIDKRMKK